MFSHMYKNMLYFLWVKAIVKDILRDVFVENITCPEPDGANGYIADSSL